MQGWHEVNGWRNLKQLTIHTRRTGFEGPLPLECETHKRTQDSAVENPVRI
jgi:hypothetical protein